MQRNIFLPVYCLSLLAALLLSGCGYGEVSPRTYAYAKSLFAISNQKDETRLTDFAERVAADVEAGELSPDEADMLLAIVAEARAGHWEWANAEVRRMMEDQIEY